MRNKSNDGFRGLEVEVLNGDLERALRKLKKKIQNSGLFQELKDREHYTKPSDKARRELATAKARNRKRIAIENTTAVDTKVDWQ
jgi:small subunit ribosomal protein S21